MMKSKSNKTAIIAGLVIGASAISFGYAGGVKKSPSNQHKKTHWSYMGHGAPAHWGDISDDYRLCSAGEFQSPVDIRYDDILSADISKVDVAWKAFEPQVINNGHTIQVSSGNSGGHARLNGTQYQLLQYHFHHNSEHTIDGRHSPMEIHFVHKSEAGDLLVLGVMVEEGAENAALAKVWDTIPADGAAKWSTEMVDTVALLPSSQHSVRYKGSLTTPPCSEIVTWNVFTQPITASREQIAYFAVMYPNNYRDVQDINRRFILTTSR